MLLFIILAAFLSSGSMCSTNLGQDAGNNEHDYIELANQEQIVDVDQPDPEDETDECCRELCREARRHPAKIVCSFICAIGFIGFYHLLFCLTESCVLPWEGMG